MKLNSNEITNHFTLRFFVDFLEITRTGKGAIYHVIIVIVIFSLVKISCFRVNDHLACHWRLNKKNTWNNERLEKYVRPALLLCNKDLHVFLADHLL